MKILLILSLFGCVFAASRSRSLLSLNEENWEDVLKGEWMVEFHAPW